MKQRAVERALSTHHGQEGHHTIHWFVVVSKSIQRDIQNALINIWNWVYFLSTWCKTVQQSLLGERKPGGGLNMATRTTSWLCGCGLAIPLGSLLLRPLLLLLGLCSCPLPLILLCLLLCVIPLLYLLPVCSFPLLCCLRTCFRIHTCELIKFGVYHSYILQR